MPEMHPVLITLGSNINREHNLPQAVAMLRRCPKILLVAVSPIYETQAIGGAPNQPAYFNAAVLIKTSLNPATLKETLWKIEQALGRVRTTDKYAPRPVDLDIAFYDKQVFDLAGRHIPDPDVVKYAHVAWPLADLAPCWTHPEVGTTLYEIAKTIKFPDSEETNKPMKSQLMVIPTNGHHDGHYATNLEMVDSNEVYDPKFEGLVRQMLIHVGEDAEREGLKRTPLRVAKAMDFLTSGYTMSLEELINEAIFEEASEEMVIVKDIEFYSLCEHHMLPFFGKAHIGYLPKGKIIGLSKLARIVDFYARRLQVQERLTGQIAETVMKILNPHGVAVVLEASHFCMMMRGVQKQNSSTVTSAMRGLFQSDPRTRQEFMQLLRG
jgi:GTP cyclohydrolase I